MIRLHIKNWQVVKTEEYNEEDAITVIDTGMNAEDNPIYEDGKVIKYKWSKQEAKDIKSRKEFEKSSEPQDRK